MQMYIYIHKSYQNLWVEHKTKSILIILKIDVKTKLYSKLSSKNYFDYFSSHTHLLKNQRLSSGETEIFGKSSSNFNVKCHWKSNH